LEPIIQSDYIIRNCEIIPGDPRINGAKLVARDYIISGTEK
jgi:hypothetical protein